MTVRTPVAGTQLGKTAAAGSKVCDKVTRERSWSGLSIPSDSPSSSGLAPWTPSGGPLSP